MANKGIHRFGGTVEVPQAKTDNEAVNLGQVKDIVNRYNKEPARVATTSELTGTYADNVLTLNTDINIVDGVTLSLDDAILVKDQLDKSQNGIYVITALGTSGTPSSATASTTSSTITNVTVDKATFEIKTGANADKSYVFTYSATDTSWKDESSNAVNLADYGISITGTETDTDTITVAYTAPVPGTGGELTRRDDFSEGKTILNNTFVNVMEGDDNGDSRMTLVSDGILTVGTSNFIFIKDIDSVQSNIKVAKATITGDGNTVYNISHNFNLSDEYAYILKIRDASGNNIYVDNVPKVGDEKNSITLTFSSALESTQILKAFILGLE